MSIITTAHAQQNFLSECVWLVFVYIHLWCTLVFIDTCIIHVGTCKIQVLINMSEIQELVSFIHIIMQILRWNNVEPSNENSWATTESTCTSTHCSTECVHNRPGHLTTSIIESQQSTQDLKMLFFARTLLFRHVTIVAVSACIAYKLSRKSNVINSMHII